MAANGCIKVLSTRPNKKSIYKCASLVYVWIDEVNSHNEDQIDKDSGPLMQILINLSKLAWLRDDLTGEQSKFIKNNHIPHWPWMVEGKG